jgi:cell division protein FtsL
MSLAAIQRLLPDRGQPAPAAPSLGKAVPVRQLIKSMPSGSLLMLMLFIAVLVSSLAVSYSAHWNRQLLNTLYTELSVGDKAQAEWGRLILEQSTWTAHNRIETLASEQLKMRIPEAGEVRLVAP